MAFIVGIDPGLTTGYVACHLHDYDIATVVHATEISWEQRFQLIDILTSMAADVGPQPVAIVVESFNLYPHAAHAQIGQEFPSVRVIGVIEAAAYQAGILDLIKFAKPHVKKNVAILHELPKSEHIKDAYQLARWYWIIQSHRFPPNPTK